MQIYYPFFMDTDAHIVIGMNNVYIINYAVKTQHAQNRKLLYPFIFSL